MFRHAEYQHTKYLFTIQKIQDCNYLYVLKIGTYVLYLDLMFREITNLLSVTHLIYLIISQTRKVCSLIYLQGLRGISKETENEWLTI